MPPPRFIHACTCAFSPESRLPPVSTTTVAPAPSPSSQRHSLRNELEQEIRDILYSGGVRESVPRLRRHTREGQQEYSQQECFRFLSHSIEQLKTRFLLRQQRAKARLKQRYGTRDLAVTPQPLSHVSSPFQPRSQTSFQVIEYCSYVVLHVIFDSLPPSTSPTRVDVLCRQKEQQIDELVRLGDEREAAEQHTEILREKVEQINTRTCQLVHR